MELKQVLHELEKTRPQVAMLGLSAIFLLVISMLLEGLRDIIWPVLMLFFIELVPLVAVRIFISRTMARSIVTPLRSKDEMNDAKLESVLRAVDGFAIKESFWIVFLWMFGATILELIAWWWVGTTAWQMVLLGILALIAAIIEALLTYHADQKPLGIVRTEILYRLKKMRPQAGTSLLPRLLAAYMAFVFMVLSMSLFVWLDRDVSAQATKMLDGKSVAFASAASHVNELLRKGEKPSKVFEKTRSVNDGWMSFLADSSGRILAGRSFMDHGWFARISRSESGSWLQKHAPFLYLRKSVGKSINMFWIHENHLVSELFWKIGIWVLLAGVLMAMVGLLLVRSIVVSSLLPFGDLAKRLDAISHGAIDEDVQIGVGGEVGQLVKGIDEFVRFARSVLQAGNSFAETLQKKKGRLSDRIDALRRSSEHREEVAEQTASSILQMRMSVDSIAEQVESLKISSTDCSSSLFEIEQSVREVSSSAENLQNLVDDAAQDISEMTKSMVMAERSMDTLAGRADDANASVSAMGIANNQVEQNISKTNRLIEQVSQIATQGAQSVEETITGINDIQLVTHEARDVINSLSQQMNAVGKILTVISDVAQQTNLLALNAAIIAAAAGEHGKGFAVVADEIKDLADRTATSTKEISGLIRSVQADSQRAVKAMERGSSSVNNGVQLANKAGDALQQILSSVSEVLRMAGEIHESTKAHGHLASSIKHSMTEMADMLRDVRQAMAEQTAAGQRVNRTADQLKDDARFVGRSAAEQVQAVTAVSRSMEKISEMVGFIAKAITEQSQGIGHVAKAAEEVRDSSSLELQRLSEVEEVIDLLSRTVEDLKRKSSLDSAQEYDA